MSRVVYNEIDKFCQRWLKNLMDAGEIEPGDIDGRDIRDIRPDELLGYEHCHFFAGIGGWAEALRIARWSKPGSLWTGSCPCQPFSQAGSGKGFADERHLWPSWFHLIDQCRPDRVLGEQVANKAWLRLVKGDLESIGYSVGIAVVCSSVIGTWQPRRRAYFVADREWGEQSREESRSRAIGRVGGIEQPVSWNRPWESALREFRTVDDGLSYGVAAMDAIRNAIIPGVAAEFISAYMESIGGRE